MIGVYYQHVDCETGLGGHPANGEAVSRRPHHRHDGRPVRRR